MYIYVWLVTTLKTEFSFVRSVVKTLSNCFGIYCSLFILFLQAILKVFVDLATIPQSINGITGHLFHTCRNAIMAIQCLEIFYVASFA